MKFKVEITIKCPTYWTKDNVVRFFFKFLTKEEMETIKVSKVEEEELELKGV